MLVSCDLMHVTFHETSITYLRADGKLFVFKLQTVRIIVLSYQTKLCNTLHVVTNLLPNSKHDE